MIERVLAFSVRQRWLVLLAALAAAISGAWSLTRLPIDAVPDVTNVQVQINSIAPAFTPIEIEKQVTVPIETVLAGTPGLESTRSFSRNGFAQVTAVFADGTDIYFARQQVAERINEVKTNLPPGVEVKMGPISTGLGEVYWWSVEYAPPGQDIPVRDGKLGWQSDGAGLLFANLGQEFTPTLDEKNIVMEVKRIPSTSLSQSQMMQFDNENMLSRFPQVAFVFSRTGTPDLAADPMPLSASDTYIILRPRDQWPDPDLPKEDLIRQFDAEASKLPGNKFGFSQPIQMRFNELIAGVREDLAVKVFGDEFGPMLRAANQIAAVLRGVDGAANVKVEQVTGLPFLEIKIDKGEIARRGLSLSEVQDVIGVAIGGRAAGLVFEHDRRFQIIVRLQDALRGDIEALQNLPVALPRASSGVGAATVPLRQLANFNFAEGPNQLSRENGKRLVVVTADVRGRDIGLLVDEAQAQIGQHVTLPPGYWLGWGGQFENFVAARQRLTIVVPLCFALIFLLLWSALSSARDALLVFSAVPLALTGGVAALWLRDMTFSISAAVGFIALSGVAVLNGLVMLSFTKQLIEQGAAKHDAIVRGALTRLRPVVMTALVASLGFVPMAIATGTGAEVQKPLATVVIGGLISATFLTLFVLPALYARFAGEEMPVDGANKREASARDFDRVKEAAE